MGLFWVLLSALLGAVYVRSEAIHDNLDKFDRTCNYTAYNIPPKLFFEGGAWDYLFPLVSSFDCPQIPLSQAFYVAISY
jgi:hypothetical protein